MENASVPLIKKSLNFIYEFNRDYYRSLFKDRAGRGCAVLLACFIVLNVIGFVRLDLSPEMGVLDIAFEAAYSFFLAFWSLAFFLLILMTIVDLSKEEGARTPAYVKNYLENRKNGKNLLAVVIRIVIAISVLVLLGWVFWTVEWEFGGVDFRPARFFISIFFYCCIYFMFTLPYTIYAADELTYPSIRSVWNRRFKPYWRRDVWTAMATWLIPICLVGAVSATALGVLVANLRGYM